MVNSTTAVLLGKKQMKEEPIHKAYKRDKEKWRPIVQKLMQMHLGDIRSIELVDISEIPAGAKIFPSTIMCKEGKVDTSKFGEHKTDAARLVVQDTRSIHSPAEVFSSVANSKAIKVFMSIVARNALKDNMRHVDVWKAFPNTLLPEELQGKLFIKLPKELGYPAQTYAKLINAIEGMRLSNHIYDRHINAGLVAHEFQAVPNDDQIIFKVESDGNFLLAVKVVDNILSVATRQPLQEQLVAAIEASGYQLKDEATDKFVGLQLEWNEDGDLLVHQERHEGKLIEKYGIKKTAVTTLPSNFTQTNYLTSGESEAIDIRDYQRLTGDIIYLQLANTAIPYAISAVSQKTQHFTKRDYEAALHILQYINGHRKQGLIFRRAPVGHRPPRLTDILHMPISIYFCTDGAHNAVTTYDNPKDQSGYFIKLYSWYTAAVECVSKTQRITLSSTEAEVASTVLALRSALDLYFILNAIGFKNICRFIAHGDSASGRTLCVEQTGLQKRSKHFNKNAAWVRNFVDANVLAIVHTPTEDLTSNALTKRVTEQEQQWSTDDIRGYRHHHVEATDVQLTPIRRRDHEELWPGIPCSASTA